MKIARALAVAVTAVIAGWGLYRLAWVPFHCNIQAKRAMVQTDYATRVADEYNAVLAARENLSLLRACTEKCPWDVRSLFAEAWNLRILKRYDDAIATYQQALRYDRRPELYVELGNSYLDAGNEEAGVDALLQAGRFDRFALAGVDRIDIRDRVVKQLESEKPTQ